MILKLLSGRARRDSALLNYVVKRLSIVPVLLGVTVITLSMIHLCPAILPLCWLVRMHLRKPFRKYTKTMV